MAIVSAAVLAVTAAILTPTLATVATAAVAVGTLVGTVGLGISVIGMATGNKTLTKIGGYLGMAGGVMTLGGGLAGGFAGYAKTLATAWDDGVGSLFSSAKPVGQVGLQQEAVSGAVSSVKPEVGLQQEALGRGIVAGTNPDAAAHYAKAGQTFAKEGFTAGAANPMQQAASPLTSQQAASPLTSQQLSQVVTPEHVRLAKQAQDIQAIANSAPAGAPSSTGPMVESTLGAVKPAVEQGAQVVDPGKKTEDPKSLWDRLPDWAKGQIAISGAQGLSGMMGGWFESATAEEKLALERQAQEWKQRNASYAPKVQFGGTLNRGTA